MTYVVKRDFRFLETRREERKKKKKEEELEEEEEEEMENNVAKNNYAERTCGDRLAGFLRPPFIGPK